MRLAEKYKKVQLKSEIIDNNRINGNYEKIKYYENGKMLRVIFYLYKDKQLFNIVSKLSRSKNKAGF